MNNRSDENYITTHPYGREVMTKDADALKNNNIPNITTQNGGGSLQQYFIPVDYETFTKWQQQQHAAGINKKIKLIQKI